MFLNNSSLWIFVWWVPQIGHFGPKLHTLNTFNHEIDLIQWERHTCLVVMKWTHLWKCTSIWTKTLLCLLSAIWIREYPALVKITRIKIPTRTCDAIPLAYILRSTMEAASLCLVGLMLHFGALVAQSRCLYIISSDRDFILLGVALVYISKIYFQELFW